MLIGGGVGAGVGVVTGPGMALTAAAGAATGAAVGAGIGAACGYYEVRGIKERQFKEWAAMQTTEVMRGFSRMFADAPELVDCWDDHFGCPIEHPVTYQSMNKDGVLTTQVFERMQIIKYIRAHGKCPINGTRLKEHELISDFRRMGSIYIAYRDFISSKKQEGIDGAVAEGGTPVPPYFEIGLNKLIENLTERRESFYKQQKDALDADEAGSKMSTIEARGRRRAMEEALFPEELPH